MMLRLIAASETSPRGVLLAPGVALIILSGPGPQDGGLEISFRGKALPAPFGVVAIETKPDVVRIVAVRLPADQQSEIPLLLETASGEHLPLYISELDADPIAIATGLDAAARWRLLEFLLNFCCAAYRLSRSAAFAELCAKLASDCTRNGGIATVEAQVLADRLLLSGMAVPPGSTLCVIRRTSITHSTVPVLEAGGLQIVPRVVPGDLVVACGSEPVLWSVDQPATVPHVLSLPEKGSVAPGLARTACRQAFGRGSRTAAAVQLLREMDFLFPAAARKIDDPSRPVGGEVEFAIPDDSGGMFLAGWLRDPLGLIDTMEIATDAGRVALTPELMARLHRPDIAKRFAAATHRGSEPRQGFVAYLPDVPGGHTVQPRLSLKLRSGSRFDLTPGPQSFGPAAARDLVLGCVPPGHVTPSMMQRCIAPAAAQLHRTAMQMRMRPGCDPHRQARGQADRVPADPAVPQSRVSSFPDRRVGGRSGLPTFGDHFVLDSPEQRNDVEHLLRGLHRLTELPVTLVVMPRNLGLRLPITLERRKLTGRFCCC